MDIFYNLTIPHPCWARISATIDFWLFSLQSDHITVNVIHVKDNIFFNNKKRSDYSYWCQISTKSLSVPFVCPFTWTCLTRLITKSEKASIALDTQLADIWKFIFVISRPITVSLWHMKRLVIEDKFTNNEFHSTC